MKTLNQQKIKELAGEIGEENVPVLLDIFLGELKQYIDSLSSGTLPDVPQYLAEISHALKSSAASFGADKLCDYAHNIDARVKSKQNIDEVKDTLEILALLKETQVEYLALLNELQA